MYQTCTHNRQRQTKVREGATEGLFDPMAGKERGQAGLGGLDFNLVLCYLTEGPVHRCTQVTQWFEGWPAWCSSPHGHEFQRWDPGDLSHRSTQDVFQYIKDRVVKCQERVTQLCVGLMRVGRKQQGAFLWAWVSSPPLPSLPLQTAAAETLTMRGESSRTALALNC